MTEEDDRGAERVWLRLVRLHARLGAVFSERLRGAGLSAAQFDVLATLTEREGLSQQELAERLYVTKGNISGLIDRLAAGGLVERRTIEGDRRSRAIYLTSAGRTLALRGVELQRAFVAETFGRLDSERLREFESLIVAIRDYARLAGGRGGAVSGAPPADARPIRAQRRP